MSDLGVASEPLHRSGDSVAPVWPSPANGSAFWMEKIMSKTNERAETECKELLDHELDTVTGGSIGSIIGHITLQK